MYTTYKLTIAAAKMFVRNRQALFFTLIMPVVIMLIFGYIGFDKPTLTDVGVVTHNPSQATQAFVAQVKSFPTFTVHEGTLADEQKALSDGSRAVVLDIPDNLIGTPGSSITEYVNEGKQGEAQGVTAILNQFSTQGALQAAQISPLFNINSQIINSHNLRYIDFLIPGLIALSVMQMSVFSVAFVFVQYKEKGVLKRLLATPMRPWQFIVANVLVRLTVAVVQTAIFIAMGVALFQVHILGSSLLLAVSVVLGAVMFLGLGFTLSGVAKTVDSVPVFANLVVFPMMFLGGTFFAVSNMPPWLQFIAHLLPLTFFSDAVRQIMTTGAGLGAIKWDLAGMFVWAAVLITLATITFSFQEKDSV
jgi:ABC-2 type transport system permease protein